MHKKEIKEKNTFTTDNKQLLNEVFVISRLIKLKLFIQVKTNKSIKQFGIHRIIYLSLPQGTSVVQLVN